MDNMQVDYPVGVQSFEKIREDKLLYVDKTQYIYEIVKNGGYFFLSRPRRFGKSLLLSTIEALFSGRRELFEGLAVSDTDWEWVQHPVFHIDLNSRNYEDAESLISILEFHLAKWEEKYEITNVALPPEDRFKKVIEAAYQQTGRKVVILVDEYDKPMLAMLHNEKMLLTYRGIMAAFYSVLKSYDSYIRFAMLTGVTRFGKLSVFSALNNLKDISLSPNYSTICGISQQELAENFRLGIHELAEKNDTSEDDIMRRLKKMYDGYHFSHGLVDVYNPFSLLCAFSEKEMDKYWFDTATPTFLVDLLRRHHYRLDALEGARCSKSQLQASDQYRTNPLPMFFQSGYLTIKDYDKRFGEYVLGYPNEEVEEGFLKFLLPYYTAQTLGDSTELSRMVLDTEEGRADDFMRRLKSFFSDFPYDQIPDLEVHYQNIIYIVVKLMGMHVRTEYRTSEGRIDLMIETDRYVYIIECKLKGTAKTALKQIEDKDYATPFATTGKTIVKIGVAFDRNKRTIRNWAVAQ